MSTNSLRSDDLDRLRPLLQNDLSGESFQAETPSFQMKNVPSFCNDFFPPNLEQFSSENPRLETTRSIFMTSAWRVVSFFVLIFIFPTILISLPMYARYYVYGAKTQYFTDGDMHSFHDDVSSFWCQGQTLKGNGSFEAYLTRTPIQLETKSRKSRLSLELSLNDDEAEEWGFHLTKGSSFSFSSCARWPGGSLIVVKGEVNMRRCFYREDRFHDEINRSSHKKEESEEDDDDDEGRERFEEESDEEESNSTTVAPTSVILDAGNSSTQNVTQPSNHTIKKHFTKKNQTGEWDASSTNHSLFFSVNDTWDVTADNSSSFSSSEEFLQKCRETVTQIDLTPYVNCSDVVSLDRKVSREYWRFTVNETDIYYFIFMSDNSIDANAINFEVLLERRLYNISDSLERCNSNSSECRFGFGFLQPSGVIVDFNSRANVSTFQDLKTYEVTTVCQPRSLVYTVFVVLIPFIILLFAFR